MPALTIGAGPTLGWKRQIVPCTESYVELFFVSSAGGKPVLNLLLEKSWKKCVCGVHVCTRVRTSVVHAHAMCTWGRPELMLGVFLHHSLLYLLKQGLC